MEWRVLPLISSLSDELGQSIFMLAHIPLFAISIALISSLSGVIRSRSRFYISAFMALHGILHAAFMGQEHYQFESTLSSILIFGSALFGLTYVLLDWRKSAQELP